MSKKGAVSPAVPSGFRDYLPKDMIPRQWMLDTIRETFELFGFLPLDTSGIEFEDVLTGKDPDFKMEIYRASLKRKFSKLALRFDLTVPLARVVSLYPSEITRPFKRYQMGKVWRGEKPQAGRFCEFMQFDADIVSSSLMSADAEIVSLIYATLTNLGVTDFVIKVNNRKILNGLSEYVGYDPLLSKDVLRVIDKLDKIGWAGCAEELVDVFNPTEPQLAKLRAFLDLRSGSNEQILDDVSNLLNCSQIALQGVAELREINAFVDALGVPREAWQIDLSVARGLGYYTGPVFETILHKLPSIGSVFSGGRYDDLVSRFGSEDIPATGASVGVDRLFEALSILNLLPQKNTTTSVVVLNFDKNAEAYCCKVVGNLRQAGIASELYLGKEQSIKGQLAYALKQNVPAIVIAGGRESESSTVQLKDTRRKTQVTVSVDKLAEAVKAIIA
jgi:histidyl-tRNA synthetase